MPSSGSGLLELKMSADTTQERLSGITRDLAMDLSSTRLVSARPIDSSAGVNDRGVGSTIGEIVLDFVGGLGLKTVGEVANSLAEVLKAYLVRERTLKIELVARDGTHVVVDAKNVSASSIEAVLKAAKAG